MATDVIVTNLTNGLLVLDLTASHSVLRINANSRVLIDQAIISTNILDFTRYRGLGLIAFNTSNSAFVGSQGATGIQGVTGPGQSGGVNYIPKKELYLLQVADITNQYIDLTHLAYTDSLDFIYDGLIQYEGQDYSLSVNGFGNTRVTFINGLATGGASALIAGDTVLSHYLYI